MKRYFLCLLLALLLPCMVVPASATGAYDDEINDNVSIMSGDLNDLLSFFKYVGDDSPYVLWDANGDGVLEEWPITEFQDQLIFVYEYCNLWLSDILYSFYDYFFTTNQTYSCYRIVYSSTSGLGLNTLTVRGTGFQRDLDNVWSMVVYGLYSGFKYIHSAIVSVGDTLTNLANYFSVADETIWKYDYSYTSDGFYVEFNEVPVTSFVADLKDLIDPIESLLYEFLRGDFSHNSDIRDEVSTDQTEASEILDVLDDVTKPDEGELEDLADISGYVDSSDVTALADVFKPLFESAVFLPCIMLNLTFMLVGYVLFGKR